jgi:cytochrome c5
MSAVRHFPLSVVLLLPLPATAQSGPELVESTCTACHSLGLIERSMGYSEEG